MGYNYNFDFAPGLTLSIIILLFGSLALCINLIISFIAAKMARSRALDPTAAFFAAFFSSFIALFYIAMHPKKITNGSLQARD